MRVVVTGATGFLGGALARRLRAEGHEVTGIGRNPAMGAALVDDGVDFLELDLGDKLTSAELAKGAEVVFHCAAQTSPWGPWSSFEHCNVTATQHVLNSCRAHAVRRLVHVSTPAVYFRYAHRHNVDEQTPWPTWSPSPYITSKRAAERRVSGAAQTGQPVVILRPRAIYGPGDRTLFPRILRVLAKGRLPVIGSGKTKVDITYIDNCVDALVAASSATDACHGRAYNITNGEPIEIWATIRRLAADFDLPAPRGRVPYRVVDAVARGVEATYRRLSLQGEPFVTRYSAALLAFDCTLDISAARRDLNYVPRVSNDEGLRRFVAWQRDEWQQQGSTKQ